MPQTKNHPTGSVPHPQGGFTLIEVMVALLIFTFGILSVLGMQVTSIQGNADAQNISEAANFGANRAEIIMSSPYSNVTNGSETKGAKYQLNWTVSTNNNPISKTNKIKTVTLTIQWSDRGNPHQMTYNLTKAED